MPIRRRKKLIHKTRRKTFFKKIKQNWRIWTLYGVFFLTIFIIIGRLYFLQIINGDYFREKSDAQNMGIVFNSFDRGTIYFYDKDRPFAVASIKKEYILAINPKILKTKQKEQRAFNNLKKVIDISWNEFSKLVANKNDPYIIVRKDITKQQVDKILEINEPSLSVSVERKRIYPANDLAAQTIGFIAYGNKNNLEGKYGIEKYWNDYLSYDSSSVKRNFFASLFYSFSDLKKIQKSNLYSTIDLSVQRFTEKVIKKLKDKFGAEFALAIIMDPHTGEIIALAQQPSFDLNKFSKFNPQYYSNKAVERVYELGSIFKPLTVAAALDAGVITENTTYNDTGSIYINGHTIYNYDRKGRGPNTSIQTILSDSLNTGIAFIVKRLGKDMLRKYFLDDFGFGEVTGIDLPYETENMTANLKSARWVEYITAGFGQGVAVTPVSFIKALGILATGKSVQPHIVKEIETGLIKKQRDYSEEEKRVLKQETVKKVAKMLTRNVDKDLAKGKYKLDHYRVAAKTGTAQVPSPSGGYRKDAVLHTFAGYFPSYEPEFVILIMLMNPKGVEYSSQSIPPSFFGIVKFLINYYQIPPDR